METDRTSSPVICRPFCKFKQGLNTWREPPFPIHNKLIIKHPLSDSLIYFRMFLWQSRNWYLWCKPENSDLTDTSGETIQVFLEDCAHAALLLKDQIPQPLSRCSLNRQSCVWFCLLLLRHALSSILRSYSDKGLEETTKLGDTLIPAILKSRAVYCLPKMASGSLLSSQTPQSRSCTSSVWSNPPFLSSKWCVPERNAAPHDDLVLS